MERSKLFHWFTIGYGCFLAIVMCIGAFAIQLKVIINPFDLNLLTMTVILLAALQTLQFFNYMADHPKEKKGGLFGKK